MKKALVGAAATILLAGGAALTLGKTNPLTDYKFWYIRQDDRGCVTEIAVRFYEGAITTEPELDVKTGTTTDVTRYRRSKRLQSADLPQFSSQPTRAEASGATTVVFTPKDFGEICTNVEENLRSFLNQQLTRDTRRIPVAEQSI